MPTRQPTLQQLCWAVRNRFETSLGLVQDYNFVAVDVPSYRGQAGAIGIGLEPVQTSPRVALQGAVDQAVEALNANPKLAADLMSPGSYQHLVNRTTLADASYGKAVERLTARIVREDAGLSASLQYQSRPFVATPDFFGYEGHNLHLLDITTQRSIPAHLQRPYGPATQYVTHPGLPPGLVFE